MGADLYIQSIYKPTYDKFEKAFNELAQARDALLTRPNAQGKQYCRFYSERGRESIAERLMLARMSVTNGTDEQNRMAKAIDGILEKLNALKLRDARDPFSGFHVSKVKPIQKLIQTQVSAAYGLMHSAGYFRESYGGGGILSRLGLSWWKDFGAFRNEKTGFMAPTKAKKFVKILSERVPPLTTAAWAAEHKVLVDEKNTLASWDKFHARRKKELIGFLNTAIDLEEPIFCSI